MRTNATTTTRTARNSYPAAVRRAVLRSRTHHAGNTPQQTDSIAGPNGTAAFKYDALGRRTEKTLNGATTGYLYDGNQAIAELQGSTIGATYLTGLQVDEMLARYSTAGDKTYLTDALGSITAQADNTGAVTQRYSYSAYGETTGTPATAQTDSNPVQYTGRENDGTGLYYYRARYYDPQLKRFTQSDPIGLGGGINTYAYVNGNPVSYYDPYGLWAWGDPIPQGAVDFSAGFGDTLSFGLTNWARNQMGTNGAVNKCSGYYTAGEVAGVAVDTVIGGGAGWEAAGAKGAGKEFSHWIPNRMGGPRSKWNGNYVTPAQHYYHDPFRYPRGWRDLGDKYPAWLQQLDRKK